ncbi:hypothetical protein EJ05DRAFT_159028 [Pseudovirgaria hyperparasitica]|uniref:UspA domain-containing protein n=1 Tax=Pseudovirgaria hyperparasitica TaxID=470096 RepID=A0A6A6VXB8_9PEZI|nr:uncharacterized protein EJ05DRAFT_159028 [Pseudovirgaria hyperparasitica]KAF2753907.1 hypothetical protein EJ05DRAFT_159028 [Pseudovirgaria hyperparasitica]
MSMESALDEERREIMALLEGRPAPTPQRARGTSSPRRSESPTAAATKSPVRSMLDVGSTSAVRRLPPRSMLDIAEAPAKKPTRSMLDVGEAPSTRSMPEAGDVPTSKFIRATSDKSEAFVSKPTRSMLDIGEVPVKKPRHVSVAGASSAGMRSPGLSSGHSSTPGQPVNPEQAYQFDPLPSVEAHALPKYVSQGGRKKDRPLGLTPGLPPRDTGRHHSTSGLFGKRQSKSPSTRFHAGRSQSPGGTMLSNSSRKLVSDSGKVLDMDNAYRKLSDAALLRSGGTLSSLANRKASASSSQADSTEGVRLEKDYFGDDDEDVVESSDDNDSDASSGTEHWGSEKPRGRRRHKEHTSLAPGDEAKAKDGSARTPQSLLAAAEDERKELTATHKYRSLIEPAVTVTGPDGDKMTTMKKSGVHPNTSFDQGGSGVSTPMNSDYEAEISEIKRAQRMAMTISPIHSTPEAHRCVRQVVRGEYMSFQTEAEQGLRRQRVYLVATDLSEEAAYALEWTIGTVLRDGDTLLAVYAVDEEIGTGAESALGNGVTAADEAYSLNKTLSNSPPNSPTDETTQYVSAEVDRPPDLASMEKAERERWTATMEVSDRCVKLLRKTKLQVRVVVEVFHCKSPKHMLTEVIDYLEPTLVILGSRGRSALKGVLLGSFSNYLVTKSSVPVMVARKRLRKHSKYKRNNLRLSNVISTRRLESAKID